MRIKVSICFLLCLVWSLNGIAQQSEFKDAVSYNDYIVVEQMKIADAINQVAATFETGTQTDINAKLDELVAQIDKSITAVRAMPEYNGNKAFRDAAVDLFLFYRKIAQNEYKELSTLITGTDYSDEILKKMSDLITKITEDEKPYDYKFLTEQDNFAKQNNFQVVPQDLEKSDKDIIPPKDENMDKNIRDLLETFMNAMLTLDQETMKKCISPVYLKNEALTGKSWKMNYFSMDGFLVQSYNANSSIAMVYYWDKEKTCISRFQFLIVNEEGQIFIEPSRFEDNYLDPWQVVQTCINNR